MAESLSGDVLVILQLGILANLWAHCLSRHVDDPSLGPHKATLIECMHSITYYLAVDSSHGSSCARLGGPRSILGGVAWIGHPTSSPSFICGSGPPVRRFRDEVEGRDVLGAVLPFSLTYAQVRFLRI